MEGYFPDPRHSKDPVYTSAQLGGGIEVNGTKQELSLLLSKLQEGVQLDDNPLRGLYPIDHDPYPIHQGGDSRQSGLRKGGHQGNAQLPTPGDTGTEVGEKIDKALRKELLLVFPLVHGVGLYVHM